MVVSNPEITVGLGLALVLSLLPKTHQRTKFTISKLLTSVWLIYSVYYKDYPVMVISIMILIYVMSQTPHEQDMAWP